MNNKIIKVFILFLVSIVISILCELFLFNYDVLFLNHNSSGIQTVKKYKMFLFKTYFKILPKFWFMVRHKPTVDEKLHTEL